MTWGYAVRVVQEPTCARSFPAPFADPPFAATHPSGPDRSRPGFWIIGGLAPASPAVLFAGLAAVAGLAYGPEIFEVVSAACTDRHDVIAFEAGSPSALLAAAVRLAEDDRPVGLVDGVAVDGV
jgi:hypothetical protein